MNATDLSIPLEITQCDDPLKFSILYLQVSLSVLGFFLNLICIKIFSKIVLVKSKNNDLSKYLLLKSLTNAYIVLCLTLHPIFDLENTFDNPALKSRVDEIYWLKVVYLILGIYFKYSLVLTSLFCEIAASFNRYRLATNRFIKFNKLPVEIVIICMILYSFGFYSFKFVSIQIIQIASINQTTNGTLKNSYNYLTTDLDDTVGFVHSSVRDGLCVAILILINFFTAIEIKRILQKKSALIIKNKGKLKAQAADTRLTIMMFIMSFSCVIAHGLQIIQYFSPRSFIINSNECISLAFDLVFFLFNNQIDFFYYYFFNLNFKRIFNGFIYDFVEIFGVEIKHQNENTNFFSVQNAATTEH